MPIPQITRQKASDQERLQQNLVLHVTDCLHCLFVMLRKRESLLAAGCPKFKELYSEAHPLFDTLDSPVGLVHMSQEAMERFLFGRLTLIENKVFEVHLGLCDECTTELHNQRMFIYALKSALAEDQTLNRDRNGATFAAGASGRR